MAPKKGVSTSLAEVKVKKPACAECRKRKKRCRHRVDPSLASEASVPPASAADAADVPPAAAQVDDHIDDNTAAMILEPALEGDQGREPTTSASGAEIPVAAAPRAATDIPSARPLTRVRISKPRRPTAPPPPAFNNLEGSANLAVNVVFSQELGTKLQEFEVKFQASMAAHQAVMEAGKAVKDLVDSWVWSWAAGQ